MKDHITSIYQVWFDFYKILTCLCPAQIPWETLPRMSYVQKKNTKTPNYVTNKRVPIYQIIPRRS